MEAQEKQARLQNEFGRYDEDGSEEFLLPPREAHRFLERLAELDIEDVSGADVFRREEGKSPMWEHTVLFDGDRTLAPSHASALLWKIRGNEHVVSFTYDVFADIPLYERAAILSHKPGVVVTSAGSVEADDFTDEKLMCDLIWHHCRLFWIGTDDGQGLDLGEHLGRYGQLMEARKFVQRALITRPGARFSAHGELLNYSSPLPRDQWLLP